ncbi:hypothetical protein EV122DRAFT_189558, partial [Schizophyllum commune]
MWLKEYLNFGGERPLWAYIVDALLAAPDYIPSNTIPREPELRISPFLQSWKNLEREVQSKRKMPRFIKALLEAAREHGVRLEGIAFSREILRRMPMWYHKYADKTRMNLIAAKSKATECLRDNHKLRTVGDFELMASHRSEPEHKMRRRSCPCETCDKLRTEDGCESPDACFERAERFLDTLSSKWDPRGEHPEDYEWRGRTRNGGKDKADFDRSVTICGNLGNAFRIFTEGETYNERVDMSMDETYEEPMIVATDGSCLNNGWADAKAGSGVFYGHGDARNKSVRLPEHIEQSNQAGEIVGALLATQGSDKRRAL